eukprot:3824690-Rhodomonas_salina.1
MRVSSDLTGANRILCPTRARRCGSTCLLPKTDLGSGWRCTSEARDRRFRSIAIWRPANPHVLEKVLKTVPTMRPLLVELTRQFASCINAVTAGN